MRALVARDLADAQVPGLSADRRFATAYNAALQEKYLWHEFGDSCLFLPERGQ